MKNKTIKLLLLICAFSASLIFSAFVRAEQASELATPETFSSYS